MEISKEIDMSKLRAYNYIRTHPGHKLFEVEISSGLVREIPWITRPYGVKESYGCFKEVEGCLYFSALNISQIERKVRKLFKPHSATVTE